MKSMIKPTLAVTALIVTLPLTGWAAAWTSSYTAGSGSNKFESWSNGGYDVETDIWGPAPGSQSTWANSFSNWGLWANEPGTSIEAYPNVDKQGINKAVNSLKTVSSSFNATSPGSTKYDLAYDIWLNGSTYEVMIWEKWSGTKPIAASYDSNGNAIASYSNQSIGGVTYNVYHRSPTTSFLTTSQKSSATVNALAVLQWMNSHYFSNPTLAKVQFGWEIVNTGGSGQNFTMNSYSATVN
jgi:hypothetical protein